MSETKLPTSDASSVAPANSQEHVANMMAKGGASPEEIAAGVKDLPKADTASSSQDQQKTIPDKFKNKDGTVNVDALLQSYTELEKKQSTPKAEDEKAAEPDPNAKPKDEATAKPNADLEIAKQTIEKAGLDFAALSAEFAENGELSEATYKTLEAEGFTKPLVDDFIEGQRARATLLRQSVFDEVRGQENYQAMIKWAEGLPQEEKDAYNKQVNSGDMTVVKSAVKGLYARFQAEADAEPNLIDGKGGPVGTTDVFRSTAEMVKAMSDPRYHSDPAYRKGVEDKLARSAL